MKKLILSVIFALPLFSQTVGDIYAAGRFLKVDIQMSAEDWLYVRTSHRNGADMSMANLSDDVYEYRKGDVTIDGVKVGSVGIRKKGFIGSSVPTRPSLKLSLDKYVDGQKFGGVDKLTLNNNNQDASYLETTLAYEFFRKAGVPAPRTSFAHVSVNGEDLGVYTNVEDVGKPMLARLFGSSNGVFYEGYTGDFTRELRGKIVEKGGAKDQKRDRIQLLSELMEAPGPVSLEKVGALVDVDAFIRFWAAEVLIGHWDGYSGNRNNFYLYQDPKTEKLRFIPWGPDSVFVDPSPFIQQAVPKSVKAVGILCQRLWELPEIREWHRAEMKRLLADVWKEVDMTAMIARFQPELDKLVTTSKAGRKAETDRVLAFIQNRRAEIQKELDAPAPEWPKLKDADSITGTSSKITKISGTFEAPFLATPPANRFGTGSAKLKIETDGVALPAFAQTGASVSINPGVGGDVREGYPTMTILAMDGSPIPSVWVFSIVLDPFLLKTKAAGLSADHFEAWVRIFQGKPNPMAADGNRRFFGIVGEMKFQEVSLKADGKVVGSFEFQMKSF